MYSLFALYMTSSLGNDPWLAPDKLGHFLFCGLCTTAGYLLCLRYQEWRQWRLIFGALLATLLGALKEVGDGLKASDSIYW